jgi:tetratricopeptide (TPR) repeat protein
VGALLLAACTFETTNPGRVLEEDLDAERAVKPLVTGMSSDFSAGYDWVAFTVALASDEMAGSGSYSSTAEFRIGLIPHEYVNWEWESISRARWVAEDGLQRMQEIEDYEFEGNELTARAYLFAGLANRVLGEAFCAPVFDGGPAQAPDSAFRRAISHFTEAIDHAQQAGDTDIETAAYGGRAQAYVGLEDWTNAVLDAGQVPTDFVYNAIFDDPTAREYNEVYDETHRRPEMSAYLTYADSLDPPDPRTPFTDCTQPGAGCGHDQGADGSTPHYQQEKYQSLGAEIPVVKGTEMRLIEAEAQLVQDGAPGIDGAIASINEVRTFWGLGSIDPTGFTLQDAWITLDHERHLTLWLEGRRFFDMRRWEAAGLDYLPAVLFIHGGTLVYPGLDPRAICIPISQSECLVNENVRGTAYCP